VKARPSGEKRRKEMLRQERNKDKEDRRKSRREERQKRAETGTGEAGTLEEPAAPNGDSPPAAAGNPVPPATSVDSAKALQPAPAGANSAGRSGA
jgi:hypothetical protein